MIRPVRERDGLLDLYMYVNTNIQIILDNENGFAINMNIELTRWLARPRMERFCVSGVFELQSKHYSFS